MDEAERRARLVSGMRHSSGEVGRTIADWPALDASLQEHYLDELAWMLRTAADLVERADAERSAANEAVAALHVIATHKECHNDTPFVFCAACYARETIARIEATADAGAPRGDNDG